MARDDVLAWVAYPRGQLGTDLDRDVPAALLSERGVPPVRQVSWTGPGPRCDSAPAR